MVSWFFSLLCMVVTFVSLHADNPASVGYINRLLAPGTHQIGDFAEGGVIFWLTEDRKHGLVASIVDQTGQPSPLGSADNLVIWSSNTSAPPVGAKADGIFIAAGTESAGKINTDLILSTLPGDSPAAQLCADYSITVNGVTYSDWYLPSSFELQMMMARQATINATAMANGGGEFWKTGNANTSVYWSSYESINSSAASLNFSTGSLSGSFSKTNSYRVRAIRAF